MLLDHLIDNLVRLQNQYAGLIWRLWEDQGVCVEFYLEELAFDCAASLVQNGVEAVYLPQTPRVVRILFTESSQNLSKIVSTLTAFLENMDSQSANTAGNSNPVSHDEEIVV